MVHGWRRFDTGHYLLRSRGKLRQKPNRLCEEYQNQC